MKWEVILGGWKVLLWCTRDFLSLFHYGLHLEGWIQQWYIIPQLFSRPPAQSLPHRNPEWPAIGWRLIRFTVYLHKAELLPTSTCGSQHLHRAASVAHIVLLISAVASIVPRCRRPSEQFRCECRVKVSQQFNPSSNTILTDHYDFRSPCFSKKITLFCWGRLIYAELTADLFFLYISA